MDLPFSGVYCSAHVCAMLLSARCCFPITASSFFSVPGFRSMCVYSRRWARSLSIHIYIYIRHTSRRELCFCCCCYWECTQCAGQDRPTDCRVLKCTHVRNTKVQWTMAHNRTIEKWSILYCIVCLYRNCASACRRELHTDDERTETVHYSLIDISGTWHYNRPITQSTERMWVLVLVRHSYMYSIWLYMAT